MCYVAVNINEVMNGSPFVGGKTRKKWTNHISKFFGKWVVTSELGEFKNVFDKFRVRVHFFLSSIVNVSNVKRGRFTVNPVNWNAQGDPLKHEYFTTYGIPVG